MAEMGKDEFNRLLAGVDFGTLELPEVEPTVEVGAPEVSVDIMAEDAVKKMLKLCIDTTAKLVQGHGFTMGLVLLVDERDGSWSYWKSNMDVNDVLAYTERLKHYAQKSERSKD